MTERKYNERYDRQKTHELVVLNNTPASSPEKNYSQLKTIRSPDNTYEQLVLQQVSHNEECKDEFTSKENAVTHKEGCQTDGYKTEGAKKPSLFACALYIGIPIITVLIISAIIVAIIGLSHAKSTADREAGLREMSVNMAEQVAALQTELGALQRELNASMEYWKTLQMQQAVSTQRLIENSIAHLEQRFQSDLTEQSNDLQTAITRINTYESSVEDLRQRDIMLEQDIDRVDVQLTMQLSSIRNDVNELDTNNDHLTSSLESHINTYESNTEEFRDRDDMLQRDIDGVSADVSTGLMAISDDVNELRTQVDMLSTNNS